MSSTGERQEYRKPDSRGREPKPFEVCPVCKRPVPRGHRLHLHFSVKHGAWCNCQKGSVDHGTE